MYVPSSKIPPWDERLGLVRYYLGFMVHDLLDDIKNIDESNNDNNVINITNIITKYGERVTNILQSHLKFFNDIVSFYAWMGISPEFFFKEPYSYIHSFESLIAMYRINSEGNEVASKLLIDLIHKQELINNK